MSAFFFPTVIFTVVGYSLYAIKKAEKNHEVFWSFGVIVGSSFFCLIAAIVSVVQLKSSGVRLWELEQIPHSERWIGLHSLALFLSC